MSDTKLKFRLIGKYELQGKLFASVMEVLKEVTPKNMMFESCLVCEHFETDTESCKMFNVRPPARIIVFGCEKFKESDNPDMDIPF